MCFAPQRRALFRHLNFQKWSVHGVFCTFWLRNVLRATTACTFSTSQRVKVVRSWCVFTFCILTSKCASRHNGVHFLDISTSKSGPKLVCFVHFDFEICFAPQRRALFQHLNFQKWCEDGVLCTFWLWNVLRARTACNFSSLIWPAGSAPTALASLLLDPPEPQIIGKTQCFDFFAHLHLLSSYSFSSTLLSSDLSLLSASALLCFSSVHIVGSLTSKLPSTNIFYMEFRSGEPPKSRIRVGFGFRVSGFGFRVSGFVDWTHFRCRFRVSGFGFRVSGFGFRRLKPTFAVGFGFRVSVSGFGFRRLKPLSVSVSGFGFRVSSIETHFCCRFRVSGFGFRRLKPTFAVGFGFRVSGFGFRVSSIETHFRCRFRVSGFGFRVSSLEETNFRCRFRVSGFSGSGFVDWNPLLLSVSGFGFRFRVSGFGFRRLKPTFAVRFGIRVSGFGFRRLKLTLAVRFGFRVSGFVGRNHL